MNNSVMLIEARRTAGGVYVFTDERVGLVDEPFVGDVNTAIAETATSLGLPLAKVSITFSSAPIPGAHITFKIKRWQRKGNHGLGHDYKWVEGNLICWLCPALFHYFNKAPQRIYATLAPGNAPEPTPPPPCESLPPPSSFPYLPHYSYVGERWLRT